MSEAKATTIHHYSKSFQGFSAMITPEQAHQLAEHKSVVSVFESKMNKLQTTHSWDFLGLDTIYLSNPKALDTTSEVIVGVIDSGIWPESESFTDHGVGPVPKKFKGECVTGDKFTLANCNKLSFDNYVTHLEFVFFRKIIGARFYSKGFEAENVTKLRMVHKCHQGSSLNPIKMKHSHGLIYGSAAAAAGVPAINASFCKNNTLNPTLIKGKIVICTIENFSDDRQEKAIQIRQGGGVGMILIDHNAKDIGFQFVIPSTLIGQDAVEELQAYVKTDKNPTARIIPTVTVVGTKPAPEMAAFSSIGPNIITPDIIKASFLRLIGLYVWTAWTGFFLVNLFLLTLKEYRGHRYSCMITIVCYNPTLQPDITGPGVNILAAWSPVGTDATVEQRPVNYNIISGTSMSCPHITAVAAIIKSHHPSWGPAAIMSSIMTTATVTDNTHHLIRRDPNGTQTTPFDYGSGHVNPVASLNPGLVYEFHSQDVLNFLCSNGASPAQLKNLTGDLTQCHKPLTASYNFNYPSIGVSNLNGSLSVYRTVTYYGQEPTVYSASIENPSGVKVTVTPAELKFGKPGEKITFRIDFFPFKQSNGNFVFGSLIWNNGKHRVRSPIGLNVLST
ncbi:hypothetical protein ACSQ67_022757 [Phaseolus vulgaris]